LFKDGLIESETPHRRSEGASELARWVLRGRWNRRGASECASAGARSWSCQRKGGGWAIW